MAVCEGRLSCIYSAIWIALIWIIIVPFEIYATMNIFKHRHHPGIRTRYPVLVMGSAIFSMFHSFICEQYYYISSGFDIDIFHRPPAPYIADIVFRPLLLIMITITVFRIYLMHYNINYVVAQSTYDWQSLLCDKVSRNDFYSRHHATFGNWKYVSRYFIAYIIIATVAEITVTVSDHPISPLIHLFWIFILIIIGALLYVNTPSFDDAYFIRKEVKYLLYFSLFCIAIYITTIMSVTDTYPIFDAICISSLTIYNFGGVVISEYIILNKIKRKDDNGFDYGRMKHKHGQSQFSLSRIKAIHTLSVSMDQKNGNPLLIPARTLFNVLIASRVCINYFVKHLQSEFCIENLLCFIELIQWIYNVTQKQFKMFNIKPLQNIDFVLSSSIPISSANKIESESDSDNDWDWKKPILIIFKKYIHSSAEYQVNLSYEIQQAFANLINLLTIKQQIENGTYILQHQSTIKIRKKRVHFSDKKTTTDGLEQSMLGAAQSSTMQSIVSCNNVDLDEATMQFSATPSNFKSMDHDSTNINESNTVTLFPNASVPNVSASKNPNVFPHHVSVPVGCNGFTTDLHNTHKKVTSDCTSDDAIPSSSNVAQSSSTHVFAQHVAFSPLNQVVENDDSGKDDIFHEDSNELVVVDSDYLYGDGYNDPEIIYEDHNRDIQRQDTFTSRSTMRSTMRSAMIENIIFTAEREKTSFKTNKLRLSLAQSLKKSLKKVNALIKHVPKTPSKSSEKSESMEDAPNDEYLKELKLIQQAKNLTAFEFVSIVSRVLHSVLQLIWQSVSRFKRSQDYEKMRATVNMDALLTKYGEKGI